MNDWTNKCFYRCYIWMLFLRTSLILGIWKSIRSVFGSYKKCYVQIVICNPLNHRHIWWGLSKCVITAKFKLAISMQKKIHTRTSQQAGGRKINGLNFGIVTSLSPRSNIAPDSPSMLRRFHVRFFRKYIRKYTIKQVHSPKNMQSD